VAVTNLVYFVGFVSEIGFNDDECLLLLHREGFVVSLQDVRRYRALFVATLPAPLRVLLCRYALTLSDLFRTFVCNHYRSCRVPFRKTNVQSIERHFEPYTLILRCLDCDQKSILSDEMYGAVMLNGMDGVRHRVPMEAHIAKWLRDVNPRRDSPYLSFILKEYLEERLGPNTHLENYRARLAYFLDTANPEQRVDRQVLPTIIDFIGWLTQYNPIDHNVISGVTHVRQQR